MARKFHEGMGQAVAERTILRKKADGNFEEWEDVAHRVALGNSLLCPDPADQQAEYEALYKHLSNANTLMSGRHLQHGDESQPTRNMEVFTNCSTSSNSFMLFYLLMNGSGVGRCYDDDMMLVDWDNAPTVRCVLDHTHPDFDWSAHESVRDARHKYGNGRDVMWHVVEDSREGWAKALEVWENSAFEKIHKDKLLILDFSKVRCKGSPIKGMQDRPASGPVPLMNAFNKAITLRGAGLPNWLQSIYIDHYFAECVLVGGARRAARMSTKSWKDKSVLDFIVVKRPIEYQNLSIGQIVDYRSSTKFAPQGFLWSSNNSITVDEEFWTLLDLLPSDEGYDGEWAVHARKVFEVSTTAAYGDGTGEPGFINVHRLNQSTKGMEKLGKGEYVASKKYQVNEDTELYLDKLLKKARKKSYFMIVNPCVTGDTWVLTEEGPRQVNDLIGKSFTSVVNGRKHHASGFWKTGEKPVFRLKTQRGYTLDLTADHRVQVERSRKQKLHGGYNLTHEWVEASRLRPKDRIVINNHEKFSWVGRGTFDEGWLVGEIVGDGGHNPELYDTYLRFWGEDKSSMTQIALNAIRKCGIKTRSDFKGGKPSDTNDSETTMCAGLSRFCDGLIEPCTKRILPALEMCSSDFCRGFLRGMFDSDGTVLFDTEKGRSVRIAQVSQERLITIQRMLARHGIASSIYENRKEPGFRKMPDGQGGTAIYWCEAFHELVVSKDNIHRFAELIGFFHQAKSQQLKKCIETIKRGPYQERFTTEVESVELVNESLSVYDCTVEKVHAFDANGLMVHNCGEIPLAIWGAFCVIADVVPYHCETLNEAEDAFRATTRALIRVNLMDSVYSKEVLRTNRIGVGITGIHEFAWKFFGLSFRDLLDEEKSKPFWAAINRFKRAVQDEAAKYAKKLGVPVPHTNTTLKPAGTTSKLFGLTEAAHLSAMEFYMRWVQFSLDDPLVEVYKAAGYPYKELRSYKNTVIIGFPTSPVISTLGMGDKLVTAADATPEEQYHWLMLLEKYWMRGVDDEGMPLEPDTGNQISYTLKYDPKRVNFENFTRTLREYQSQVKCCSVMPQEDTSSYEYLPEQSVTKAEYEAVAHRIKTNIKEDLDFSHIDCKTGACPIDFAK